MPQDIKTILDFKDEGTIVNIPDGVNDQDAVNVRQLHNAVQGVNTNTGKYIISGGAVWSGTGLTYNTSYIPFFWNGNKLAAPTSLTLADSDATNNRLDAIVVDEAGNVTVITGTASASPITPAIPEDQLLVQYILVEAGTTEPDITQESIYLNNAEWTFANYTTSGSQVGTSNADATDSPKEGTKCIDNSLDPRTGIRFSRATSLDITPYTTFAMWIRIPASIDPKETLLARFENTSFAPIGNQVDLFSFGIQKTVLGTWQLAIVPVSAFGVTTVQGFRLIMTGGKNGVQVLWDADFITITDGSSPVTVSPEINFYKDSVRIASQKGLDIVAGTGMGITAVEDPAKETVKYTFTPDTNKAYVDAADAVLQGNIDSKEALITPGTTAQYWRGDKTWQSFESSVLASMLSGLSITGGAVTSSDSVLSAFGKLQNQMNAVLGGASYQGVWNASTNSPALADGVGTKGFYYVVSVDGTTDLDGITDWKVGDWAIFNGTTWDKVDNTDAVSSVNGAIGAVSLAGTANRITVSGTTFDIASTYAGQSSITAVGTIGTGVWQGTAIATDYGGTGLTSYAKGDVLIATAANTVGVVSAPATDGYVFTYDAASGLPMWKVASGGGGSGIYAGTGTAFTSYAKGDLIYASATNVLSKLAATTDGYVLTLNSGGPIWAVNSSIFPSQTGNAGKYLSTDGTNVSWQPFSGNTQIFSLTRTVPGTVGQAVDIGSFTLTNGAANFDIWITIPSTGYAQSKRYYIPASWNGTGASWKKVLASSTTGAYTGNQDSDLEINSSNGTTSFRIRRVIGTFVGTAYITIQQQGVSTDSFTPSTATAAVSAPASTYNINSDAIYTAGNVTAVAGIFSGTLNSQALTATSATVSGNIFTNTLRVYSQTITPGTTYSLSNWNGTGVPVPAYFETPSINGAGTLNPEEPALVLGRRGTAGAYQNAVEFNISRYANSSNWSFTRLGISLLHGSNPSVGTNVISFLSDGRIGIGIGSTALPNAASILEIASTTKGVLLPRMTTTQKNAIPSPGEGLEVYDTTLHKKCIYTGSAWETITSA